MRSAWMVVGLMVAGCGARAGDPVIDATAVDAADVDGARPPAVCGGHTLAFARTETETTAALTAVLAGVDALEPAAYYREALDGTRAQAVLTGLRVALAVGPDVDPRPAAVAWLARAAPATFAADEWTIDPLQAPIDPAAIAVGDVLIGNLARTSVAGVPWPADYPARWVEGGGLAVIVDKTATGWALRQVTITPATALATRTDAETLAACTPPTPGPEAALRARSYQGVELAACAPTGTYSYTPGPGDVATWRPGLGFALGDVVDGRARWHPFAKVELVIAERNYWPTIAAADCMCAGVAGFTLRVDAVTGEVLHVSPAINCTVC